MLWNIQNFSRKQWATALQGDWDTKTLPIIKPPHHLTYYRNDHYSHKTPLMRFVILGEPVHDEDYNKPLYPVLAIAQVEQFHPKEEPHVWSMPYISVDQSLHNVGVARELFRHALAWLKENDPNVVLARTANSETGKHWQHVGDTELFAAKIPWTQGERGISNWSSDKVRFTDFESPSARMVDALQRKNVQDVQELLRKHPGHDWSAPNDAFVHPLRAALQLLPDAVPLLLNAGAKPAVEQGWIGHTLINDHDAYRQWLQCFEEHDRGKAFVLSCAGHTRHLKEHPVWNELSQDNKQSASIIAHESGTYTMRSLLNQEPNDVAEKRWEKMEWNQLADVLAINMSPTLSPKQEP